MFWKSACFAIFRIWARISPIGSTSGPFRRNGRQFLCWMMEQRISEPVPSPAAKLQYSWGFFRMTHWCYWWLGRFIVLARFVGKGLFTKRPWGHNPRHDCIHPILYNILWKTRHLYSPNFKRLLGQPDRVSDFFFWLCATNRPWSMSKGVQSEKGADRSRRRSPDEILWSYTTIQVVC